MRRERAYGADAAGDKQFIKEEMLCIEIIYN